MGGIDFPRRSFTAFSGEAQLEMIVRMRRMAAEGGKYVMELNAPDFERLLDALDRVRTTFEPDEITEWSEGMISSMAETLNVEMV